MPDIPHVPVGGGLQPLRDIRKTMFESHKARMATRPKSVNSRILAVAGTPRPVFYLKTHATRVVRVRAPLQAPSTSSPLP